MSARANAAILLQALKDLKSHWEQTRAFWDDARSRDFEKKYLEQLPSIAAQAASAMEELDGILKKVTADCE